MKKIVASVGVVALGASGVQAASVPSDTGEPAKPWSVSATLRGFYDNNINSASSESGLKQDSFGFDFSPSAMLNWTLEQTTISVGYVYTLRYYENKPFLNTDHIDNDHTFNASITHAFSERYRGSVSDAFVVGQEPDVLRVGGPFQTFQRIPGDNIRNYGNVVFDAQMTRLLGLEIGYANSFWDYAADQVFTIIPPVQGGGTNIVEQIQASTAGALNQIAQSIHLDGRWLLQPPTIGVLGYQYSQVSYTADQFIGGTLAVNGVPPVNNPNPPVKSDIRNSRSHYGYVGVDHTFRPDFTANLRVGAQAIDFYNDPSARTDVSPYAQISLRYTYALQSYVEGGFTYNRSSTDLIGYNAIPILNSAGGVTLVSQSFTTDAQTAVVYGTLNHRITPKLFGSITAQFQDSTYNGGQFNNDVDRYYLVGLNLEYRFSPHLAADVGYNYDRLDSDIPLRTFDRNRVYIGVTASY